MVSEVTYLPPPGPRFFSGLPKDVAGELDSGLDRAFPHSLPLAKDRPDLWLRYGVTGRGAFELGGEIDRRDIVGWVCIGPHRVGMIRLREWRLPPWIDDRSFFWAADGHSEETFDFGRAVLSAWPIERLVDHGDLVQVCRIWMDPRHAKGSLWALAINALVRRRCRRGYAAMLLNTFPEDYKADSIDTEGWRGRERWDRRRTALGRLAQRKLGVRPLPRGCPEDDQWWLWRPLTDGVPAPRKRRLSWL